MRSNDNRPLLIYSIRTVLFVLIVCSTRNSYSQTDISVDAPSFEWIKMYGGDFVDRVSWVEAGQDSCFYVAGTRTLEDGLFSNSSDVANAFEQGYFVSKMNLIGEPQWTVSLDTFGRILDMAVDDNENAYFLYSKKAEDRQGKAVFTNRYNTDYYILSLSSNGVVRWIQRIKTNYRGEELYVKNGKLRVLGSSAILIYDVNGLFEELIEIDGGDLSSYMEVGEGGIINARYDSYDYFSREVCLDDSCICLLDSCALYDYRCDTISFWECRGDGCIFLGDSLVCKRHRPYGFALFDIEDADTGITLKPRRAIVTSEDAARLSSVNGSPTPVFFGKAYTRSGLSVSFESKKLRYADKQIVVFGLDSLDDYNWHTVGMYEGYAELDIGKWVDGKYYLFGTYNNGDLYFGSERLSGGDNFMLILDEQGQVVLLKNIDHVVSSVTHLGDRIITAGNNDYDANVSIWDLQGNKLHSCSSIGFGGDLAGRLISSMDKPKEHLFLHGRYDGRFAFDDHTLEGAGGYLAKMNIEDWQMSWFKSLESTFLSCWATQVYEDGSVFFSGEYEDSLRFDELMVTTNRDWGIYYGKLDPSGNLEYLKDMDVSWTQGSRAAVMDSDENVIIGINFRDKLDIGGHQRLDSQGERKGVVCKIDPSGRLSWVTPIQSEAFLSVNSLAIDKNDNAFAVGAFTGTLRRGSHQLIDRSGGFSGYVSLLNAYGTLLWSKSITSIDADIRVRRAKVNANNELILYGQLENKSENSSLSVYIGEEEVGVACAKGHHLFVAKLDINGDPIWFKVIESVPIDTRHESYLDVSSTIDFDEQQNIYVGGHIRGGLKSIDNVSEIKFAPYNSMPFVAKISNNGFVEWLSPLFRTINMRSQFAIHYQGKGRLLTPGAVSSITPTPTIIYNDSTYALYGDRVFVGTVEEGPEESLQIRGVQATTYESHMRQSRVYPNPTKGDLRWRSEYSGIGYLVNTSGSPLIQVQFDRGDHEMDLSNLPIGSYQFIQELDNGQRFVEKIIKQ